MMKKFIEDFTVIENLKIHANYGLLKLTTKNQAALEEIHPGQFVQVEVEASKSTFLRRPISINFIDVESRELWLLVRNAGEGTRHLIDLPKGKTINLVLPLGNGFTFPDDMTSKVLLVGGGVGVAPLLQFGKELNKRGIRPSFLLGARSASDLLQLDMFEKFGDVYISTDDGSMGEKGVVTLNSCLSKKWDQISCCGPAPMMKAVAAKAREIGAECEVSLENMMACGLGACLCCVEKTVKGNVCVCTEGPVFNINELTW